LRNDEPVSSSKEVRIILAFTRERVEMKKVPTCVLQIHLVWSGFLTVVVGDVETRLRFTHGSPEVSTLVIKEHQYLTI
jgi:hypothetical protein